MHIDLTPAVPVAGEPRTTVIFHSKPGVANNRLLANPWGFAQWFEAKTPREADFAKMFAERAMAHDRAPAEPVPDQEPAYLKSRALITLQLMKRWRNVRFAAPARENLRRPPSILLAKHIADHANRTDSLSAEVEHQARYLLHRLEAEAEAGRLIHEVNPTCGNDVITDRWPETHADQALMIDDLRNFAADLALLRSNTLSIDRMAMILERLFGDRPAKSAVKDYLSSPARPLVEDGTGRVVRPAVGLTAATATLKPAPAHTFYGDKG